MSAEPRLNDRIRVPEVRVIGPAGEQLGIMPTDQALDRASSLELDLVEVAPQADPPVVKIMDYGKFRYEQDVRTRESKKKQAAAGLKEMRFSPKISPHDYENKKRYVEKFLAQGSKVKVMILFKGRMLAHTEFGARLMTQLANDLAEVGTVEVAPKLDGRNMVMVMAPLRKDRRVKA